MSAGTIALIIASHFMLLIAVILVGAIAFDLWVDRKARQLNREFQRAWKQHPTNRSKEH